MPDGSHWVGTWTTAPAPAETGAFAPDAFYVDSAAPVREAGIARYDEQGGIAGQRSDHIFGDPVREELLLGIAVHVLEGEHGDRGLVGKRQELWRAPIPVRFPAHHLR